MKLDGFAVFELQSSPLYSCTRKNLNASLNNISKRIDVNRFLVSLSRRLLNILEGIWPKRGKWPKTILSLTIACSHRSKLFKKLPIQGKKTNAKHCYICGFA